MKHIPRLFIKEKLEINKTFFLDVFDSNHILHVLKKNHGDKIIVFNDTEEWEGELFLSKKTSYVKLDNLIRTKVSNDRKIKVYLSVFKRFDIAVEKLVEIGVTDVVPVITDFSHGFVLNKSKINKIVKGALEQSNRFGDCVVRDPIRLCDIKVMSDEACFACIERSSGKSLLQGVSSVQNVKNLSVLIGPEGGFSAGEVDFINGLDFFIPVSLGDNILRVETASICAAFILKNSV